MNDGAIARARSLLAALLCLLVCGGLLDSPRTRLEIASRAAPPVPTSEVRRDGELRIAVVDDGGAPVPGARLTILWVSDHRAYLAGSKTTDAAGKATIGELPRGEMWVLGESLGRERGSRRVTVDAGARDVALTLRAARALRVNVVDESEQPVPSARVLVRGGDPLPFVAETGPEGVAELPRLGLPSWTVEVSANGYSTEKREGVSESPIRVSLRRLGTLVVSVLRPDGEPASGASVLAVGSGLWPARTIAVDASGRATIGGLPAGAYDLFATEGGLASRTLAGTPLQRGETKAVELRLGEGTFLTVSVRDADGDAPISGASVVVAENGLSSFPHEGTTDDAGEAHVGPLGEKRASVAARAEGYVPRAAAVGDDTEGPVVIRLLRGATLSGEVVDDRGFPVSGASIEVIGTDGEGGPVDETPDRAGIRDAHFAWALPGPRPLLPIGELGVMPGRLPDTPHDGEAPPLAPLLRASPGESDGGWVSRADGHFSAKPVPPGRLRALVRHPSYVEAVSDPVTIGPGGEGTVKVVLHGGGRLEGRVLDGSQRPVAGARVELAATHGSLVRSVLTADDGSFAFAGLPAEISLSACWPETPQEVAVRKAITVKEDARTEIDLVLPAPRDPVIVKVKDDRDDALDAVQISVTSLSEAEPLRKTVFTGPDGTAVVPSASGLAVRLEITLPGRATIIRTDDALAREISVVMKPGTTIKGEVRGGRGGDPIANAEITLSLATGVKRTRTDKDGAYAFRDLTPGSAHLAVFAKGFAPIERADRIPEPDRDRVSELPRVELAEAGTVEGDVVDERGDPVPFARVSTSAVPAYVTMNALPRGVVAADAHGHFSLSEVGDGEHVIEAYAADRGRGRSASFTVTAGRTTEGIRIKLDEAAEGAEPNAEGGVAVTLAERRENGASVIAIVHVAEGSEAEHAGVREDDVLVRIDGHPPVSIEKARARLAGPLGDDVLLVLERDGEEVRLRVQRERVRR